MNINSPNNKDLYRQLSDNRQDVAVLKEQCKEIKYEIKDIKENHLPRFQNRLEKAESRQTQIFVGIIILLIGVLIDIIVNVNKVT